MNLTGDSLMPHSTYHKHGHPDRKSYLRSLAREHGVSPSVVFSLADLLGPDEDFDALPMQIEDWQDSNLHFCNGEDY
jgi:hypothetical protein